MEARTLISGKSREGQVQSGQKVPFQDQDHYPGPCLIEFLEVRSHDLK